MRAGCPFHRNSTPALDPSASPLTHHERKHCNYAPPVANSSLRHSIFPLMFWTVTANQRCRISKFHKQKLRSRNKELLQRWKASLTAPHSVNSDQELTWCSYHDKSTSRDISANSTVKRWLVNCHWCNHTLHNQFSVSVFHMPFQFLSYSLKSEVNNSFSETTGYC